VAAIVVDAGGENQIAVASGANAALDGARVDAALAGLAPLDEAVCLLNLEVPDGALVAAARAASAAGMVLVVDPAPARALPDALLDARPVLVPNEGEARELTGRADAEAAGRALAARTGAPVVVTRGAAGALLVDGGDAVAIAAPRVRAVDTTGAGDTLSGVLAAELARATPLAEAVAVAVRAAAAATRVRGARAGMPRPGELAGLG
jgi:ribokinase